MERRQLEGEGHGCPSQGRAARLLAVTAFGLRSGREGREEGDVCDGRAEAGPAPCGRLKRVPFDALSTFGTQSLLSTEQRPVEQELLMLSSPSMAF